MAKMEQRRRPPTARINYRVNPKSGHIHSGREVSRATCSVPYSLKRTSSREMNSVLNKRRQKTKVSYMDDYRNQSQQKLKKNKKGFLFKRVSFAKKSLKQFKPVIIVGLLVVLSFAAVYQNAQLQSWGLSVSEANAKLIELQNQNEALKQEKAELTNLDRVERIAKNDLKMVAPTTTVLFESKESKKDAAN